MAELLELLGWKTALIELHQSPNHSQYLFHPSGADLIFHTHSPFNMIVGMPVNLLWGEAAAYNFCILLGLWMAGWGMYLLVKDLTQDSRAAFLAGVIFAYFPQHLEQTLEHLNLASVQFMPLTLWFFFRTVGGAAKRNVVGLGACFALNALCSWHLGMMLLLLLAFAGVWGISARAATSPGASIPLGRRRYLGGGADRARGSSDDQRDRFGRRLLPQAAGRPRHRRGLPRRAALYTSAMGEVDGGGLRGSRLPRGGVYELPRVRSGCSGNPRAAAAAVGDISLGLRRAGRIDPRAGRPPVVERRAV